MIESALTYPVLVDELRRAFANMDAVTPQRSHIKYDGRNDSDASTLLLMPSWVSNERVGVKIVTVSPENGRYQMPAIHGVYVLFDATSGECTHVFDAAPITTKRTAATSALASSFLSRTNSETMLMVGTGSLAPELIKAHASVRPIKKIWVWGRDFNKAIRVAEESFPGDLVVEPVRNLEEFCSKADIISCATLSKEPLLRGMLIKKGQHIDLVGSYLPTTREADDDLIRKAAIFIDHAGAMKESGDLFIPLQSNVISSSAIRADLHELSNHTKEGRRDQDEVTLFKSVGHAMEDLVAAQIISRFSS